MTGRREGTNVAKELRKLPKIDDLVQVPALAACVIAAGRERVVRGARDAVEKARKDIQDGACCPSPEQIIASIYERVEAGIQSSLRAVINATGVVIHTNLGRSPLSEDTVAAMGRVARGYSNLEFDLEAGERGSRYVHCSRLLAELSAAEDAVVVNNNAAAVMLLLAAFARGREVVVSRGQLLEIGGGFRIPDVMRESGAHLVEVGTTNRTYPEDYRAALTERTAALMVMHRSNFQLTGFVHDPELRELAALAREHGVLLIDDLGSGSFLDTAAYGLPREPRVQDRVAAGADLVCFSGDKLVGGPQAGFIVGRKDLIARIKRVPMLRALRVDKVTLAGIEATLQHYRRGDAEKAIPIWRSISATPEELEGRVQYWRQRLGLGADDAQNFCTTSPVGGGSLPGAVLPTRALALRLARPDAFAEHLRAGSPPVIGRIEQGLFVLDARTVLPHEDEALLGALKAALDANAPRAGHRNGSAGSATATTGPRAAARSAPEARDVIHGPQNPKESR